MKKKLSIVIPCFNEEKYIKETVNKVLQISGNYYDICQIIIINDGSTDKTKSILDNLKNNSLIEIINLDLNKGKGFAIQKGFEKVNQEVVLIQDADLEYDPGDYDKLIKPYVVADADVVFGSRFLGGGDYVRLHYFYHF